MDIYVCSISRNSTRVTGSSVENRRTLPLLSSLLPPVFLFLEDLTRKDLATLAKLSQQCVGSQGLCVGRGEGRGTSYRCRRPSPREALLVRWDRRQVSSLTEQQRDGVADSGFSRADFAVSLDVCLGACRRLGSLA